MRAQRFHEGQAPDDPGVEVTRAGSDSQSMNSSNSTTANSTEEEAGQSDWKNGDGAGPNLPLPGRGGNQGSIMKRYRDTWLVYKAAPNAYSTKGKLRCLPPANVLLDDANVGHLLDLFNMGLFTKDFLRQNWCGEFDRSGLPRTQRPNIGNPYIIRDPTTGKCHYAIVAQFYQLHGDELDLPGFIVDPDPRCTRKDQLLSIYRQSGDFWDFGVERVEGDVQFDLVDFERSEGVDVRRLTKKTRKELETYRKEAAGDSNENNRSKSTNASGEKGEKGKKGRKDNGRRGGKTEAKDRQPGFNKGSTARKTASKRRKHPTQVPSSSSSDVSESSDSFNSFKSSSSSSSSSESDSTATKKQRVRKRKRDEKKIAKAGNKETKVDSLEQKKSKKKPDREVSTFSNTAPNKRQYAIERDPRSIKSRKLDVVSSPSQNKTSQSSRNTVCTSRIELPQAPMTVVVRPRLVEQIHSIRQLSNQDIILVRLIEFYETFLTSAGYSPPDLAAQLWDNHLEALRQADNTRSARRISMASDADHRRSAGENSVLPETDPNAHVTQQLAFQDRSSHYGRRISFATGGDMDRHPLSQWPSYRSSHRDSTAIRDQSINNSEDDDGATFRRGGSLRGTAFGEIANRQSAFRERLTDPGFHISEHSAKHQGCDGPNVTVVDVDLVQQQRSKTS